ncbi:MAG: inorganic triphosphatase [Pontibacterium sp.]
MAVEVELKLGVSRHLVESLKQQPILRSQNVTELGSRALINRYFDTPDGLLAQHKVALRIREKEGRFIQTLKTAGIAEGGLHTRQEWEWELDSPKLNFELLKTADWPQALAKDEVQAQIKSVFSTNFRRTTWMYQGNCSNGEALSIEMVLDQGEVVVQREGKIVKDEICEVELELKDGNPEGLFAVALELGQQIPLLSSDLSKAQRGYRLLNPETFSVEEKPLVLSGNETQEEAFCAAMRHELSLWPQYLEMWQFKRDWKYISLALESLRNIGALYQSFSDIIPANPNGQLNQILTKLLRQLRDIEAYRRTALLLNAENAQWAAQAEEHANQRMEVLLQTVGFGQMALRIARQLEVKRWRLRWNEEQTEKAAKLFSK